MSAKAGITDGEWRLSKIAFANNDGSVPVIADRGDDDSSLIATVHSQTKAKRGEGWKVQCAERDANARLIAAAPDLYAVVAEFLEWHEGPGRTTSPLAERARAALAKAVEP